MGCPPVISFSADGLCPFKVTIIILILPEESRHTHISQTMSHYQLTSVISHCIMCNLLLLLVISDRMKSLYHLKNR